MNIAYYVSNHGFGHISRSFEIIKFLLQKKEVTHIFLNTKRKEFITEAYSNLTIRDVETDLGVIQKNSLSIDIPNTLEAIYFFEKNKKNLIEQELSFLEEAKIDFIISDCSSLPFVLGKKLGLRAFCISNFTWDFIYENYAKENSYFEKYSNILKEEYSECSLGLILPFACPIESIPRKQSIGIIGRYSYESKASLRKALGWSDKDRFFLFSFGAYGIVDDFNFSKLSSNEFIVTSGYEHLNGDKVIDIKHLNYPDLVKACDYVLTKPGYGILAEAYLAGTPIIYTDRGDFAEYKYLLLALEKFHYSAYITHNELLNFSLKKAIIEIEDKRNQKVIAKLTDGRNDIFQKIF